MNIAPLPASERDAIAARYGIAVDRVPAVVTVCPPRTFTEAQETATSWKAQIAADVANTKDRNARVADEAAKRRAAWLAHVVAGKTHIEAALLVGVSRTTSRKYSEELRAEGVHVPNRMGQKDTAK